MKLFIVCPRLCHGGAERVAVTLANGFIEKGHHVSFFSDLFEEQSYNLDDNIVLYNLVSKPFPKIWKWGGAVRILRKAIKKENPDVIIGIMSLCSLISRVAAVGLKTTVIATEHNAFERPESSPMPLWDRLYKFHVSKIFKCVTMLTEADKKVLGVKRKNVVVMPNPLAITPSETVPPKKNVILAAGRVDNWRVKGFDTLIRAWANVVSNLKNDESENCNGVKVEGNEWRLQIAGVWRDTKTREYLDGIAKECGVLNQIDYLGFVDDMKSVYQNASIFVLSSRYEGFGLVLIEAMSQGCACVACDYKGRQREIIAPERHDECKAATLRVMPDGRENAVKPETDVKPGTTPFRTNGMEVCENGILCEPDNVEALAEGIKRMIEDEEYRREVQRNSIERSKAYGVERTIQRWEELLNQIVK